VDNIALLKSNMDSGRLDSNRSVNTSSSSNSSKVGSNINSVSKSGQKRRAKIVISREETADGVPTPNNLEKLISLPNFGTLESIEQLFELNKRIGRGAFGVVWKARNKQTHSIVALKVLQVEEESAVNSLIKEITIMREIKHRNIVNYFGCYHVAPTHEILIEMELCELGSLMHFMKKK